MRASVRGEFTSALDSLSSERASLLSEVSELRYDHDWNIGITFTVRSYKCDLCTYFAFLLLKSFKMSSYVCSMSFYRLQLADAVSEKASIEKEKRREADGEVREIHER